LIDASLLHRRRAPACDGVLVYSDN